MVQFILYVKSQAASSQFYKTVFDMEPVTDVPGMTEFLLQTDCRLGLMPESGISRILSGKTPDPSAGNGIPRCELYLYRNDMGDIARRLLDAGAKEISPAIPRDWGDEVGYYSDPDGHIIAIARKL